MAEPASTAQIFQAFKRGRRNAGKPVTQKYHEPILAVVACTQRSSALALSGLDPVTTVGIFVFWFGTLRTARMSLPENLNSLSMTDLKALLTASELPATGVKSTLIERIVAAKRAGPKNPLVPADFDASEASILKKIKALFTCNSTKDKT